MAVSSLSDVNQCPSPWLHRRITRRSSSIHTLQPHAQATPLTSSTESTVAVPCTTRHPYKGPVVRNVMHREVGPPIGVHKQGAHPCLWILTTPPQERLRLSGKRIPSHKEGGSMSQPRWGVVQDSEWRFQDTAGSRVE